MEREMTDYNDGNWHGWQGGDCPVHPKSEVEGFWLGKGGYAVHNRGAAVGMNFKWDGGAALQTFRVITPYDKPPNGLMMIYGNYQSAVCGKSVNATTTRWIEVLE
jgi:hypothetical protein